MKPKLSEILPTPNDDTDYVSGDDISLYDNEEEADRETPTTPESQAYRAPSPEIEEEKDETSKKTHAQPGSSSRKIGREVCFYFSIPSTVFKNRLFEF